jgi:hypothetical protein
MPLLRRAHPLVRAEVALHGPRRAAVLLHAGEGRWPEHEARDRLTVGVGMAALTAFRMLDPRWVPYRAALATLATGVARADAGPLPGDLAPLDGLSQGGLLQVVPWEGPGRENVEVEIVATRGGPVPRIAKEPESAGPVKEIATLALLVALAADAGSDGRLALALGIEGLLAWFRESDRLAPTRNALAFALAHADGRLRESGRPQPA